MRILRLWVLLSFLAIAGAVAFFSWRRAAIATQAVNLARSAHPAMVMPARSWSVSGPGGPYGFSESFYTKGDYARAETQIFCGPFDFIVHFRADTFALMLVCLWAVVIGAAVMISFQLKRDARRRNNAA